MAAVLHQLAITTIPAVQIAVTSGYPLDHLTHLKVSVAPTNFIQKPWSLAEIIAFVRALLDDD